MLEEYSEFDIYAKVHLLNDKNINDDQIDDLEKLYREDQCESICFNITKDKKVNWYNFSKLVSHFKNVKDWRIEGGFSGVGNVRIINFDNPEATLTLFAVEELSLNTQIAKSNLKQVSFVGLNPQFTYGKVLENKINELKIYDLIRTQIKVHYLNNQKVSFIDCCGMHDRIIISDCLDIEVLLASEKSEENITRNLHINNCKNINVQNNLQLALIDSRDTTISSLKNNTTVSKIYMNNVVLKTINNAFRLSGYETIYLENIKVLGSKNNILKFESIEATEIQVYNCTELKNIEISKGKIEKLSLINVKALLELKIDMSDDDSFVKSTVITDSEFNNVFLGNNTVSGGILNVVDSFLGEKVIIDKSELLKINFENLRFFKTYNEILFSINASVIEDLSISFSPNQVKEKIKQKFFLKLSKSFVNKISPVKLLPDFDEVEVKLEYLSTIGLKIFTESANSGLEKIYYSIKHCFFDGDLNLGSNTSYIVAGLNLYETIVTGNFFFRPRVNENKSEGVIGTIISRSSVRDFIVSNCCFSKVQYEPFPYRLNQFKNINCEVLNFSLGKSNVKYYLEIFGVKNEPYDGLVDISKKEKRLGKYNLLRKVWVWIVFRFSNNQLVTVRLNKLVGSYLESNINDVVSPNNLHFILNDSDPDEDSLISFSNIRFSDAPRLGKGKFLLLFYNCTLPLSLILNKKLNVSKYETEMRNIKRICENNSYHYGIQFANSEESKARTKSLNFCTEKVIGYFAWLFNNVGEDIARPMILLLFLNLFMTFFMFSHGEVIVYMDEKSVNKTKELKSVDYSFYSYINYEKTVKELEKNRTLVWKPSDDQVNIIKYHSSHYFVYVTYLLKNLTILGNLAPSNVSFLYKSTLSKMLALIINLISVILLYLSITGIKKRFQQQ